MDDHVFLAQRIEIGSDRLTQTRDNTPHRDIHMELKQFIHVEFRTLREALKEWRKT